MEDPTPDLIVGIDFGMTCTGVAYLNLSIGAKSAKCIQIWPGRAQANENKVPTVLVYSKNTNEPSSWGFLSETATEQYSDDKEYVDWFKTFLDPNRLAEKQRDDPEDAPRSMAEVERWYEDYLRKLYQHIEFKLSPELSRMSWHNARVGFIFSVPTTWKPLTVEKFRTIAEKAGFGQAWNHTMSIGLTEAEAAAVHTSIEASAIFREGEILLVCDAGGGTTDLSVLKVKDTQSKSLSLQQLDVVFGQTIGSAAIDYDFEDLVKKRLVYAYAAEMLSFSPAEIAWEMMKSRDFQNTKCEHGGPHDTPSFLVPIPQMKRDYVNHELGIEYGEMRFTRSELQILFDKQVQKLVRLIDKQLQNMQQRHPNETVAHLILSGGLGHSAYVQERLKGHYELGTIHPNATSLQVRVAPDPQLAVCKGLVLNHLHKLRNGNAILKWRCCRASYGTLCKELYDKNNILHAGRPTVKDPLNKKIYVTGSIAWFIKKGQPISADEPIIKDFSRNIVGNSPERVFPTSIVTSHVDANFLPHQLSPDVQILCDIKSDLSAVHQSRFKHKNRHIWSLGQHYCRVDYQVKVLIGPADIRFELYFDGQKLNNDQPIKVEWADANIPDVAELDIAPNSPKSNGL